MDICTFTYNARRDFNFVRHVDGLILEKLDLQGVLS